MREHRITFVYGASHYQATQYIREKARGGQDPNTYRNITNPQSVRGLKSSENTQIEFIWLRGCEVNRTYHEMCHMVSQRQEAGAEILEMRV